jgi:hypothetical protein
MDLLDPLAWEIFLRGSLHASPWRFIYSSPECDFFSKESGIEAIVAATRRLAFLRTGMEVHHTVPTLK